MENMEQQAAQAAEKEKDVYVPRPAWQVWCARVALVLFIGLVLLQILRMARGEL